MTERLNLRDPKANMYGCLPCPKCGSEYRWPQVVKQGDKRGPILCECGYKSEWEDE